ncbi:hypothetical protein SprV_0200814100 [Sparganum proliferum]
MQVVGGEDHIDGSTASSIATLAFREKSMFQIAVETVVEDAGEDLPGDVEQQDSFVIITELSVPFQFVEMDSCGVMQILRDVALVPALLEYRLYKQKYDKGLPQADKFKQPVYAHCPHGLVSAAAAAAAAAAAISTTATTTRIGLL